MMYLEVHAEIVLVFLVDIILVKQGSNMGQEVFLQLWNEVLALNQRKIV